MADTVYLLWYVREWAEGEDTELLIGVYRNEAAANDAIERVKDKPGFVEYPKGFLAVRARQRSLDRRIRQNAP